jgi:hypothetical protein
VNGRDCVIFDNDRKKYVPLTDEDPAGILMAWRNPIESSGVDASSGEIVYSKGEGYPEFFESLGVKPAAPGGASSEADFDPTRTCCIRACDVVLTTPRTAVVQTVSLSDPFSAAGTIQLGEKFVNDGFRDAINGGFQHRLLGFDKFDPPREPTMEERFFGTYVEPQEDQIKIATVWLVSPPDWDDTKDPDGSWTAYPKYDCFWNLCHASQQDVGRPPNNPITLYTGLVAGFADSIFQGLLSPVNDAFQKIEAAILGSNFKGKYWSI